MDWCKKPIAGPTSLRLASIHPAGEHVSRATWIAERIAAQAPLAVQATRRNAELAATHGEAAAQAGLMDAARALMDTEDAAEGLLSFVERREAVFRGR